jgi:hypothetical protein
MADSIHLISEWVNYTANSSSSAFASFRSRVHLAMGAPERRHAYRARVMLDTNHRPHVQRLFATQEDEA